VWWKAPIAISSGSRNRLSSRASGPPNDLAGLDEPRQRVADRAAGRSVEGGRQLPATQRPALRERPDDPGPERVDLRC
jgi:hypothetical protein